MLATLLATSVALYASADPPQGWFGFAFRAQDDGARITMVHVDTPAQAAGLRKGDVITEVDGRALGGLDASGVVEAMAGAPDTTATLTVQRGDQTLQLEATRSPRPPPAEIERLRLESTIRDAPPGRRVAMRLRILEPEADGDDVADVWRTYLDERGEHPLEESAALAVVGALEGRDGASTALDTITASADESLATKPRYQRRVAEAMMDLEPPRAADAVARAKAALDDGNNQRTELPWLHRVAAEAQLAIGDPDAAVVSAAAAVDAYAPPTLIWLDPVTGTTEPQVVGASATLARLHAQALVAAGDDEAARQALSDALAYRHDTETAVMLDGLGGTPPAEPVATFSLQPRPFPAFDLPRIDGGPDSVTLDHLAGAPALVVLWASWCGPCRAELEHLAEHHQDYVDAGVTVLAINVMDKSSAARQAAKQSGWPFRTVRDDNGGLADELGVTSIPRSFALDADGRVVRSYKGFSAATAGDQLALLAEIGADAGGRAHLLAVELGAELLHLDALIELPLARLIEPATRAGAPALAVATVDGRVGWLGDDGSSPLDLVASIELTPKRLHAMPDGTLAVVGKKAAVLIHPDGGTDVVPYGQQILSSAVAGDQLLIGPGGKSKVQALTASAEEIWTGEDFAVSWDLLELPSKVDGAVAARLIPGELQLLAPNGETGPTFALPDRPSRAGAAAHALVLSSSLEALTHGDLLGNGREVTVVLLRTRQVLGLDADGTLMFRFLVSGDTDLACADLDGDGRDELWLAMPDIGVACLRVGLDTP